MLVAMVTAAPRQEAFDTSRLATPSESYTFFACFSMGCDFSGYGPLRRCGGAPAIGTHEPWRPVLKALRTRGEAGRSAVDDPKRANVA
jgi:hypothetical protein